MASPNHQSASAPATDQANRSHRRVQGPRKAAPSFLYAFPDGQRLAGGR